MKRKELIMLFAALLMLFALASCGEDDGTIPEEEEEQEEPTEAPDSWVLVNSDSFFIVSRTALPAGSGPYRYQINFASREQLNQNNNDGGAASTFAIGFAFESRPTETGTFTFTNDRFTINSGELNLYQSFFLNTGHAREDKNYISESGVTVDVDITDSILSSDLEALTMINEADDTDSFTLKWSLNISW